MEKIRHNIFETNSSSTHVVVICTVDEYKKFVEGELAYNRETEKLEKRKHLNERELREKYFNVNAQKLDNGYVYDNHYVESLDQLIDNNVIFPVDKEKLKYYDIDDWVYESYDDFMSHEGMEYTNQKYTSPSGDDLVVFGYGGYDS